MGERSEDGIGGFQVAGMQVLSGLTLMREKRKMWSIFYCTVMIWQRRERRW